MRKWNRWEVMLLTVYSQYFYAAFFYLRVEGDVRCTSIGEILLREKEKKRRKWESGKEKSIDRDKDRESDIRKERYKERPPRKRHTEKDREINR